MERETITAYGVRRRDRDLVLPATPLVRVSYKRDGVTYDAVINNPRTNERLQQVMLARNVGMSQVQCVTAMQGRRSA